MRSLRHRQYSSGGSRGNYDSLGILGPAVAGPLEIISPPAPAASAAAAMMMMNAAAALPPRIPTLPQPLLGVGVSSISAQAPLPMMGLGEQMPLIPPAQLGGFSNHPLLEDQAMLISRHQSQMGPSTKIERPLFSQLGLGVSRCSAFSADATEAALLAVKDALGKIALPPLDCIGFNEDEKAHGNRRLLAQIKLGVPADGGTAPQRPMRVDHAAVIEMAAPYNIDTLPVQVVLGGLVVEDDSGGNHGVLGMSSGLCVAVASVTIVMATVTEKPLQHNLAQRTVVQHHGVSRDSTAQLGKQPELSSLLVEESTRESAISQNRKRPAESSKKPQVRAPNLSTDNSKRQKNTPRRTGQKEGHAEKKKKDESSGSSNANLKNEKGQAKKANNERSPKKPAAARTPSKSTASDSSVSSKPAGSHNFSIHSHPSYTDHAAETPTRAEKAQFEDLSLSYKTPPFPMRLHRLVEEVSKCSNRSAVVGWLSHGRAFRVLDVDLFVQTILPEYFRLTKYCSFLRQLNLYGFRRIGTGPDRGSYYSEWFLRGRPVLTSQMRRIRVNGNGRRIASDPDTEPDLYSMLPVEELEKTVTGNAFASIAEATAGANSELVASKSGDGVCSNATTSSAQKGSAKPVASIVSSEDTVSEDDAGGGLLALRAGV